jgi:Icc-related predicted phosphoesterase
VLVKVISDVHGDLAAVQREAATCEILLVLGDLINIVDYENSGGILAEVYGSEAVREWAEYRKQGLMDEARRVFREAAAGRDQATMQALLFSKIDDAHAAFCGGVPSNCIVTYGNVDVPDLILKYLPDDVVFADACVLEIDGQRFGFVGGGLPKIGIPGEVSLDDYQVKVDGLGPVDVLCAHVPPAIDDLAYDVVADFLEPGSGALLAYIERHQPRRVYYGHVHQPRAATAVVGSSVLVNVGHHFRTTGKATVHE